MRDSFLYDVVIAGAGPVGLFLACELRLADLSVLVLEQAPEPHSPLKQLPFGMRGLSISTVEAFYRRGLLDDMVAPLSRRMGGHFAGIPFHDNINSAQWTYRLPSPASEPMAATMAQIEAALAARAAVLGVELQRGTGVDGFAQSNDDVTIQAAGQTVRARWLVGCDGGRSVVRKAGGFVFDGTAAEFTGYSVDVELADAHLLAPGRHYTPAGMYNYQQPGTIAMVDFDGGAFHRSAPLTLDNVQSVLRRVSGTGVGVTALRLATSWTDRACQATAYRNGRVLLAGDAAHIHSPLGGQGLNLGLGDAINLGWKLAATIRGDAPAGLLDTYCAERHPVGAQILDWSRAQVALMRPNRSSRALEAILRDLIDTGDGASYFAGRIRGLALRYELGGTHPLAGRSMPDFALAGGARAGVLLRSGQGLLLDFGAGAPLAALAGHWRGRIVHIAGAATDTLGLSAVLVRPDGIVAWASDGAADIDQVARAAARWFGNARDVLQFQ